MIRLLLILLTTTLTAVEPAAAQERPGESQRVLGEGMTHSKGVSTLVAEIYGATPAEGGWPPMRYFSPRLQARIALDRSRAPSRVPADWLRRGDVAWPSDDFHAWVLNTTGASPTRPANAVVSLGFGDGPHWGRRIHLIDQDDYWVIDSVCLFPEGRSLDAILDTPGPSEADPEGRRVRPGDC